MMVLELHRHHATTTKVEEEVAEEDFVMLLMVDRLRSTKIVVVDFPTLMML